MMTELNRWWSGVSEERYWLEATGRDDVGADLHAPAEDERGKELWSYLMLREPASGDVVFHYEQSQKAITGFSFVQGDAWEDKVYWGAKGASATSNQVKPYIRDGYRRGLYGFQKLEKPITLSSIRSVEPALMTIRDELSATYGGAIYFPFVPYKGGPLRTAQGYMFKLPLSLVKLLQLPETDFSLTSLLNPSPVAGNPTTGSELANPVPGSPYRPQDEDKAVSIAAPMAVDPAVVERGLRGHRRTQNQLAEWLLQRGIEPKSPDARSPDWDIAWKVNGQFFVCEVKSLTDKNEERQLRLGLGQVLRYRQKLGSATTAVLATERAPTDSSWIDLCTSIGVLICWPGSWERALV